MIRRTLLQSIVLLSLIGAGVVHAVVTGRWSASPAGFGWNLDHLPLVIGDWEARPLEADPEGLNRAAAGPKLLRIYVNRRTGEALTVFLACGPTGPIVSSHLPESCYPGAGYVLTGSINTQSILAGPGSTPNQFRVATFSKADRAVPLHVRVCWSWSDSGLWQTPENPRMYYAGRRHMCKLYVVRQLPRGDEAFDGGPAASFIPLLVPELARTVFANSQQSSRAE